MRIECSVRIDNVQNKWSQHFASTYLTPKCSLKICVIDLIKKMKWFRFTVFYICPNSTSCSLWVIVRRSVSKFTRWKVEKTMMQRPVAVSCSISKAKNELLLNKSVLSVGGNIPNVGSTPLWNKSCVYFFYKIAPSFSYAYKSPFILSSCKLEEYCLVHLHRL